MKYLWLDSWYQQAYEAAGGRRASYDDLFRFSFGTSNYWDIALRAAGHESETLIANHETDIIGRALEMKPDVICSQNVGMFPARLIRARGFSGSLVGLCSYQADGLNLLDWSVLFSSFQWLVDALNRDGQRAVYLPLAFGRPVLDRVAAPAERDIPVAFFGGLGSKIWRQGTETMAAVAEQIPDFKWWGYKVGQLPESLNRTYQGECWGVDYFRLLMRTKICLNRHGEIAKGEMNCMRVFEALGCGCFLFTDGANTAHSLFPIQRSDIVPFFLYDDAEMLVATIRAAPAMADANREIAEYGRQRVLAGHCYEHRVPAFLSAVEAI